MKEEPGWTFIDEGVPYLPLCDNLRLASSYSPALAWRDGSNSYYPRSSKYSYSHNFFATCPGIQDVLHDRDRFMSGHFVDEGSSFQRVLSHTINIVVASDCAEVQISLSPIMEIWRSLLDPRATAVWEIRAFGIGDGRSGVRWAREVHGRVLRRCLVFWTIKPPVGSTLHPDDMALSVPTS